MSSKTQAIDLKIPKPISYLLAKGAIKEFEALSMLMGGFQKQKVKIKVKNGFAVQVVDRAYIYKRKLEKINRTYN